MFVLLLLLLFRIASVIVLYCIINVKKKLVSLKHGVRAINQT